MTKVLLIHKDFVRRLEAEAFSAKVVEALSGTEKFTYRLAALGNLADVTDQSTTAEDLANPIEDTAEKLAMFNDYRSKLESLAAWGNRRLWCFWKKKRLKASALPSI